MSNSCDDDLFDSVDEEIGNNSITMRVFTVLAGFILLAVALFCFFQFHLDGFISCMLGLMGISAIGKGLKISLL